MKSLLRANIGLNLIFYRRNKLLFVVSVFIIVVLMFSSLPVFLNISGTGNLRIVILLFSKFSKFAMIITAGLGLLFVSHHVGNRSLKMVFTKPCSPEAWFLSSYLSASLISAVLYAGIIFLCSILFLSWDIPFQWGLLFVAAKDFCRTIILLSYITFFAVIMHPVIALLTVFIFRDGMLYAGKIILAGGIKVLGENSAAPFLKFSKMVVDGFYMIVPAFDPYAEETSIIYTSFRIPDGGWTYLFLTLVYTIVVSALFYFLSVYFLKNKRHI